MELEIKKLRKRIHQLEKQIEKIKNWIWLKYEDEIPQEILKDEPDLDLDYDLVKAVKREQIESILPDTDDHHDEDNFLNDNDYFESADSYGDDDDNYHQEKLVNIPIKNEIVIPAPPFYITDTQKQKLIEDCYKKVAVIHLERLPIVAQFSLQKDIKVTETRTRSSRSAGLKLKPIQIGRRFRTRFTKEQLSSLKSHFKAQHHLGKSDIETLSKELNLLPKVIARWFTKQRVLDSVVKTNLNGEANSGSILTPYIRKKKSRPRVRQTYPVKCDQPDCNYTLSSYKDREKHKKTHADEYNKSTSGYLTTCLVKDCQTQVLKHKLKDHLDHFHSPLSYNEPKPIIYQCPQCLLESYSRSMIQKHISVKHNKTHENENNVQKSRVRIRIRRLNICRNEEDKERKEKLICHLCGNKCKDSWERHLQKYHLNPRQYKCQVEDCSWAFNEKMHLINHQRVHWSKEARKEWRNSRKTPCTVCGEMITPVLMKRHTLLKHQKRDQDQVCGIGGCTRTFAFKYILWEHYRVHMNQKRDDYNEEFTKNCPEEILKFLESRRKSVKKYATKYNAQKREMKKAFVSNSFLNLTETELDPPKTENLDEAKEIEALLKDPSSTIQVHSTLAL